ncbi:hypothetical protein H0H87_002777 [Tephrocybe sp. NHM501043]|nr:hypothetical protein H0H87_002777 [Tephrocybe sp. NHM501043]
MSYTNGSTPPYPPVSDDASVMDGPDVMESDVDDEVDQLDSESDTADTEADAQNGVGGQRIPGQTLLPPMRLENIMAADGVTGNLALSKEGLFVLSVATVRRCVQKLPPKIPDTLKGGIHQKNGTGGPSESQCRAKDNGGIQRHVYGVYVFATSGLASLPSVLQVLQPNNIRSSCSSTARNIFNLPQDMALKMVGFVETIPVPISLSEALSMRTAKEREVIDTDPSAPSTVRPSTSASASASKKVKSRLNGTAPKHDRRSDKGLRTSSAPIDVDSTYSDWTDTRPPRAGGRPAISIYNGRLSVSARPSPLANGHSASTAPSRSGTLTPAQSHDQSDRASPQHQSPAAASPFPGQSEENWSAQAPYTGPASGFLQGPGGPFGRVEQNPGRTIYSQQFRAE